MKRGFTLLELVVVIIILGVLATLGIQQYGRMIERARGAEARTIIGQIRSSAAAYRLENGSLTPAAGNFNNSRAGIGPSTDQIPSACRVTHYFRYTTGNVTADGLTITATRCTAGGKTPNAATALNVVLTTDFVAGTDQWSGTGGY